MEEIIKRIQRARKTPVLLDPMAPFTDPLPGLKLPELQDIVDAVLAYGFPSFYQGSMTLNLPISQNPVRVVTVDVSDEELLIFAGNANKRLHERTFANAYLLWEEAWPVADVRREISEIDAKMRALKFFDVSRGRRLALFDAGLLIPVEHVFPGPHAFYDLSPETKAAQLIKRFDNPQVLNILAYQDRRVLCHKRHREAVTSTFKLKDQVARNNGAVDPIVFN